MNTENDWAFEKKNLNSNMFEELKMTWINAASTKESGHSNVVNHRTQTKTKIKQFVSLQLSNKVQTKLRVAVLVGVYSPTFRRAVMISRPLSSEFPQ